MEADHTARADPIGNRHAPPPNPPPPLCMPRRPTGCHRFPLGNFKYFLTLFSKFFSSFPHGTFSLSVSRAYLALEEIYLPLGAAIPNNSTRRLRAVRGDLRAKDGIVTLSDVLFQGTWARVTRWPRVSRLQPGRPPGRPVLGLSSSRFTRRYWGNPC